MAGSAPDSGSAQVADGQPQGKQTFAFIAMTCLFFFWGFITVLNDILIPFLKESFDLNYTQAMLVQFCFFGAYFIAWLFVYPYINMFLTSVRSHDELYATPTTYLPRVWQWRNYIDVWDNAPIASFLKSSLIFV
mgnify:CR=1 FL=1